MVSQFLTNLVPHFPTHFTGIGDAELSEQGHLHAGIEDCPVGDKIGISTTMRLDIGMFCAEQLTSIIACKCFNEVDIVASGIEAVIRIPFAVLVRQQIPHGQLAGDRGKILTGDQFQVGSLICQLIDDSCSNLHVDICDLLKGRRIGDHSLTHLRPAFQVRL